MVGEVVVELGGQGGQADGREHHHKVLEDVGYAQALMILQVHTATHTRIQSNLDISKLMGLFFTSSNYPKCKLICTSGNLDL